MNTEENTPQNTPETAEEQAPQQLTLHTALNNVVGAAREVRLNYQEHSLLERSIQMVVEALNNAPVEKAPESREEV